MRSKDAVDLVNHFDRLNTLQPENGGLALEPNRVGQGALGVKFIDQEAR